MAEMKAYGGGGGFRPGNYLYSKLFDSIVNFPCPLFKNILNVRLFSAINIPGHLDWLIICPGSPREAWEDDPPRREEGGRGSNIDSKLEKYKFWCKIFRILKMSEDGAQNRNALFKKCLLTLFCTVSSRNFFFYGVIT